MHNYIQSTARYDTIRGGHKANQKQDGDIITYYVCMHNQNCLNINHKIGLLVDTIISFHACDPKVVKLYFLTLLADCVQIVVL